MSFMIDGNLEVITYLLIKFIEPKQNPLKTAEKLIVEVKGYFFHTY